MAYRIVAKSPKHLNDIVEDIMTWFETARDYRTQFDTESIRVADPVTKQIGVKDIDVLYVQDPATGKKTVIKFIPLLRPEEMKIVMGGENEHVMKGKLKNMMKGRGEFKTYNKDTLRKMENQIKKSELNQLIREEVRKVLNEEMIKIFSLAKPYKGSDAIKLQTEAANYIKFLQSKRYTVSTGAGALYFPDFVWAGGKQQLGKCIGVLVGSNTIVVSPIGKNKEFKVGETLLSRLMSNGTIDAYLL